MPLGMEVGLSPGDFVLHGEWGPSPPLNFRPMFIIVIVISSEHSLNSRYWFVQVQVLELYAFYFWKKKFNRTQSVPI